MKYKVVGFNPKGMGIPVKNHERFFDYRYLPEEMEFVVDHVKSKYPSRNLYLVGFSLGATFQSRFLSKKHNHGKIKAFVSIGNTFDVYKASLELNSKKNFLYGLFATKALIKKFLFNKDTLMSKASMERVKDFSLEKLLSAKTTFDYDKYFTFKFLLDQPNLTSEKYYKLFSCEDHLTQIETPTLFLQIRTDPLVPYENIPIEKIKHKKNFILAITPYGGHVDFFVNYNAKRVSQKVEC